jgi:hypothetical protein
MKENLMRALILLMLLFGTTAVAMAIFKEQVSSVLFSDEYDDY